MAGPICIRLTCGDGVPLVKCAPHEHVFGTSHGEGLPPGTFGQFGNLLVNMSSRFASLSGLGVVTGKLLSVCTRAIACASRLGRSHCGRHASTFARERLNPLQSAQAMRPLWCMAGALGAFAHKWGRQRFKAWLRVPREP